MLWPISMGILSTAFELTDSFDHFFFSLGICSLLHFILAKMSGEATKANTGSTPSETSTAAEVISSNVDLLTEILLRLPAKSLIRFKCVSKHWLYLICHPQFATNHSLRNPSPSISGLYFYGLNSVSLHGNRNLLSLSFLDGIGGKHFPTTIQHSCNGLLLLQTGCLDLSDSRLPLFIVCNPTTRKYTILPKTSLLSRLCGGRCAYMAFDPSKSTHYKVVVGSLYNTEIVVYDSESGTWKNISPQGVFGCHGVFWNGAIHWLRLDDRADYILWKFDTDTEEIIALPLSARLTTISKHISYFGECGGRLILILVQSPFPLSYPTEFPILELESENSGWIVKYQVNLRTIISALGGTEERNEYFVLGVVKGGKKEDYVLVLAILGKVILYNLKSKTMDELRDLVPGEQNNGIAYPFVETLSHFLRES